MKAPFKLIDVSKSRSESHLHQLLRVTFDFPQWYGNNWDAFADCMNNIYGINNSCLMSCDIRPILLIKGFGSMIKAMPNVAAKLMRYLKYEVDNDRNPLSMIILVE